MARQLGKIVENKFTGGLITEATGLSFPENAAVATSNCVFTTKNSVTRRVGFNLEASSIWNSVGGFNNAAISEFVWLDAGGIANNNYVINQVGSTIYFYAVVAGNSLSQQFQSFTINMDSYSASGAPTCSTLPCQYAAGYGYLFIVHPYCDPFYVIYNTGGNFTLAQAVLQQRDFVGQADGLSVSQRPSVLTDLHKYNLMNQGWTDTLATGALLATRMITTFNSSMGAYPSNADIWYLYKDQYGNFSPNKTPNATSSVTSGSQVGIGTTPAPLGHFILNCFNQNPAAAAQTDSTNYGSSTTITYTGLIATTSGYIRPSTCAFFAGRIWYGGVNAQGYANQLYYSRIIQKPAHISQCYSDDDPTGSDLQVADLLPSDGGVLIYPEWGTVYKLYALAYSLLVFCSNGVWAIAGSTGAGFSATDYSVNKLSTVGMISATSFVDVDGTPVWWNTDGIYTMAPGQTSGGGMMGGGGVQIKSISELSIKTFFNNIPSASKQWAKGTYNRRLNQITWLYSSTAPVSVAQRYQYDSALCQNTLTQGFFPWTLPLASSGYYICGLVTFLGTATVVGGTQLQVTTTKFITQNPATASISFAELWDTAYKDFTNSDYQSYATGGYNLEAGGSLGKEAATYVIIYVANNIANTVTYWIDWDFANSPLSSREATGQTVTTTGTNYDYQAFKRKLRGTGRALQVSFISTSGLPFEISGWAVETSANTGP